MTAAPRLALTADLHWGHNPRGDEATRGLVSFLAARPPDLLVLAGDIGTGEHFAECLALFRDLPCKKALVPGNHDLWVALDDTKDSLQAYTDYLPRVAAEHGFHYLDRGPLLFPDAGLAVVGSVNWYDYSWSRDEMQRKYPAEVQRFQTKRFTRGRHNDAVFVRWPLDDATFTARVVGVLREQLDAALAQVGHAVVVTHHPSFLGISFPQDGQERDLDRLLWDAFGGNAALEEILRQRAGGVAFAFCGHTHWARENTLDDIRGYNIGGGYPFKRLLWLEWPERTITAHEFGTPV
jgi:3',5'-cyclic AMP phosphodiesterase CpdA